MSTACSTCGGMVLRTIVNRSGSALSTFATTACTVAPVNGGFTHEHLVRHRAERVDVGARVDRALTHRLLGAHVLRRAEREAGLRHARPPALCTASAMPKSATRARPSCRRMFSGLMSRWITPWRCA
jgi:hypothetical protein